MIICCPHTIKEKLGNKMCKKCADLKPYVQFKMCDRECLQINCKGCGYFWGPGSNENKNGKRAYRS